MLSFLFLKIATPYITIPLRSHNNATSDMFIQFSSQLQRYKAAALVQYIHNVFITAIRHNVQSSINQEQIINIMNPISLRVSHDSGYILRISIQLKNPSLSPIHPRPLARTSSLPYNLKCHLRFACQCVFLMCLNDKHLSIESPFSDVSHLQ